VRRKQRAQRRQPPPSKNGRHHADGNGHGPLTATATLPLPGKARVPAGSTPSTNGRDGAGKFTVGNSHGRGNPFMRSLAANRSAILKVVGAEQVEQLTRLLLTRALGGDLDCVRIILGYAVGRPAEVVDPDAQDDDELRRLLRQPLALEVVLAALEGVTPAAVLDFVRKGQAAKGADPLAAVGNREKMGLLAQLREKVVAGRAARG
jgi:hypothetical protein